MYIVAFYLADETWEIIPLDIAGLMLQTHLCQLNHHHPYQTPQVLFESCQEMMDLYVK